MMPPHTTSAPSRDGDVVVFEGYSLNYADLDEDLVILDADGEEIPFKAKLATTREDRAPDQEEKPLGSQQVRGVLTVRLGVPQGGRAIEVMFLGDVWQL